MVASKSHQSDFKSEEPEHVCQDNPWRHFTENQKYQPHVDLEVSWFLRQVNALYIDSCKKIFDGAKI